MKKYLYIIIIIGIVGLVGTVGYLRQENKKLSEQLSVSKGNEKALLLSKDSANSEVRIL